MLNYEIADGVATVTLSRPPANAINRHWVKRFHTLLDDLDARNDWNVLHIRSALRVFCAGADIKEMRVAFEGNASVDSLVTAVREYQTLFARIEAIPRITLAEIGGPALGGGFELALSCDLRIIADEASVGLPEIRLGLLPGAGGTQRLTRLCGRAMALRIINGAEIVDGRTAVQLGMAQWRAPADELQATAARLARQYASQLPLASRLAKACINAAAGPDPARGYELEYEGSDVLLRNPETQALIAEFLASRK